MTTATIYRKENLVNYFEESEALSGPHMTVSLRASGGGAEWQTHRTRLDAALHELSKDQALRERYDKDLDGVIEQTRRSFADRSVWSGDYESLCVHATTDTCVFWKLGYAVAERSVVGDRFVYKDAARAIESSFDGLVLRLTLKHPALYRVKGSRVAKLKGERLPESIYALSEQEIVDGGEQAHVRNTGVVGTAPEIVSHGTSERKSVVDLNLQAFLREIIGALYDMSGAARLPLVVIGDEKLVGWFSEAYSQNGFVKVTDAKSRLSEEDIGRICARIAERSLAGRRSELLETLANANPRSEVYSDNLKEIFENALQGRVNVCAVASDVNVYSEYDQERATLTSANRPSERFASNEVLDRILVETVTKDGRCIAVPSEEMPGGKKAVAIYKW